MTRIDWIEDDPCQYAHAWIPVYRWVFRRWWLRRHFFEKCLDCGGTRGR